MRFAIAAVVVASSSLAAVVVACTARPGRTSATAARPDAPTPRTPTIALQRPAGSIAPELVRARADAHDMLARHCGSCHEGRQPSAKPAALAIFDLDRPDWPVRFDARRFEVALHRLASKPDADKAVFVALRDAELASRRTP